MLISLLQISLTLTHLYILGNKRKRKAAAYFFIHQCWCLSLLYNTKAKKYFLLYYFQGWLGRRNGFMPLPEALENEDYLV